MPTTSDRLVKEFWAWMKLTAPVPWPRCMTHPLAHNTLHTKACQTCIFFACKSLSNIHILYTILYYTILYINIVRLPIVG
jgi:hypothetical protein